ncbi:MAG: dihydroorotate dehydrogenase electron transfer subunit [Eubacteriales bacterium]|nr:dihydroorotate dehydrogenase electron transfer subunit [Eubacteriales bacterium]
MSRKVKESCAIISQELLEKDIYSLWIQTETIARNALPGQFVSVYMRDKSKLLPRPLSICEIDRENGRIRLVYRVTGKDTGTEALARLHTRIQVEVLGPLGNGFPLEEGRRKRVLLMGGGIGIPPMLQTAKELKGERISVLGYRDRLFLNQEFENYGDVYVATEDGSAGTEGNVLDAVREHHIQADVIFACGPKPMLKAVKAYALKEGIPCWISMEERMACGIGACLGCVCQSAEVDGHSHVHNKRVCKDGPVFLSTEVEL